MEDDEPTFAVTALCYRTNAASSAAYERIMPFFVAWNATGDSLYRFTLDGSPTIAALTWTVTEEHLADIAALPWGRDGEPVPLPPTVCHQLAARSREAAPQRPDSIRRVHRGPTGEILRDRVFVEGEESGSGGRVGSDGSPRE
jgi:hypothetical protein